MGESLGLEPRPDIRFRTWLRCFGRTRETRYYGPVALFFGISALIKEGPARFLLLFALVFVVAGSVGFVRWRSKRLVDPEYANRGDETSSFAWSAYGIALLIAVALVNWAASA